MTKAKAKKPKTPKAAPVPPPVPIYEPRYFLQVTLTQCLALADGIVLEEVKSMARMVDRPSLGLEPYATIIHDPGTP